MRTLPDDRATIVVNPKILWSSIEKCTEYEGCLSLPGLVANDHLDRLNLAVHSLFAPVKRAAQLDVEFIDGISGQIVRGRLDGIPARIFAHELDHLDGVLFIDHVHSSRVMFQE